MYDLIVAGAGPAGLATALYAAKAGLRVAVLEPRPAPIDKACGEGLMPGAVCALQTLGVALPGTAIRGIRYLDGRRSAEAAFGGSAGRGVRRTDLHTALLEAVSTAGVHVSRGSVGVISQDEYRVRAAGLTASYLVAADGLHSPIRHALHLDEPSPPLRRRWGLRQHFAVKPWTDFVEVHWSATAEAYVTPVADNLIGVAVLSGSRRGFAEHLSTFPELQKRLPSTGVTEVRGAGPLRQTSIRRVAGRVLFVGDAAGYVDALTGEGIAVALKSAHALVRCLVTDQPRRYEREWAAASRNYRAITTALLWAARHRALRPTIVPIAATTPALFRAAVHQLAR